MAQKDYKTIFQGTLTGFLAEEDPIKAMLEWLLRELMGIEVEGKVGAPMGEEGKETKTNFYGYQLSSKGMIISGAYKVIKAAVRKKWLGASWHGQLIKS
ncbi:MAG: hypothetical protein H5U07_06920 [Candidatus Aminicenantes bacterium]|nr:hypothetical protein [Candidatus Aminicenantes bacterium]